MSQIHYMTKEGLEKLKEELTYLRTKGRQEIAKQIAEAREKGDISENAEYDAAKDAQGHLELKISQLNEALANARVLETDGTKDASTALILSTVEIKNLQNKKVLKYMLVSEQESDFKSGKISVTSPIGKGLLGKAKGDVAEIQTPAGLMKFEILSISR